MYNLNLECTVPHHVTVLKSSLFNNNLPGLPFYPSFLLSEVPSVRVTSDNPDCAVIRWRGGRDVLHYNTSVWKTSRKYIVQGLWVDGNLLLK
jgi:hypothetical protein